MVNMIFKNGFVYTMNDKAPVAEAVAVEGQKIKAVGTNEEIMALKDDQTKVIDLEGKMLLPGFIDAHCHPAMCAFFANGVLIDEDMKIPEVEATIEAYIKENPDKMAYFGIGYNEFLYDEKGPKKEDLDKFCADKPVIILGSGGHEGWCNSKALELAGVDKNTPDPFPGFQYFERDDEGNPTGHLVETGPESIVFDAAEYFEKDEVRRNFIDVSTTYSEMGVTSLVTCGDLRWMQKISVPVTEELATTGQLQQRLQGCAMVCEKDQKESALEELREKSKEFDTDAYRVNVYKILLDGTAESRSASMLEPYDEDGSMVEPLFEGKELQDLCVQVASEGYDIHIHGIGDRAIREVLNAAKAVREAGYTDTRITNAHTQFVTEEDKPLFGKYNVIANTTGVWHYGTPESENVAGKRRQEYAFTMKDLIDGGARMSLGSDRPVDEYGPEPLNSIEVACTRKMMDDPDAPVLMPEDQKLTVHQCLEGYTTNAAYQMRMEDKLGTIEAGKYADMVVLGENILEIPLETIHNVSVEMTIADGKIVFEK